MGYEVDCSLCHGEGEVKNMFEDMDTCPNCRGAGRVIVKRKKLIASSVIPSGYVSTAKVAEKIDNDKDKIVIVKFDETGKDVSHWFTGTEEFANQKMKEYEHQGKKAELMTPTEYYKKYGGYHYLDHVSMYQPITVEKVE